MSKERLLLVLILGRKFQSEQVYDFEGLWMAKNAKQINFSLLNGGREIFGEPAAFLHTLHQDPKLSQSLIVSSVHTMGLTEKIGFNTVWLTAGNFYSLIGVDGAGPLAHQYSYET